MSDTHIKYQGAAPTGTATIELLNTATNGWPKGFLPLYGVRRLLMDFEHSHAFTLRWWKSNDRGANWYRIDEAAVTKTTNETSIVDVLVQGYQDLKVDLVNGGTNQSPWDVNMTLVRDRSTAA